MKAKDVMRLLRISRATLHRYAEKGNIRYTTLPSGIYNYHDEDIYKILNKDVKRKNYIYARVSTAKQKKDLENQIEMLKSWVFNAGIKLDGIYRMTPLELDELKQRFQVFPWSKQEWEMFTRTEQIWLSPYDIISAQCHYSKNLWNEANYQVRQEFFATGKWIRYNTLAGSLKTSENYKSLNAQTAQQILKILDRSWKAFFKSIKEYAKHP